MKKVLLLLTFLIAFIAGASAQTPRLSGRQWKLEELNGSRVAASTAYLEFERGQRRFSGNAGCNRIFGSVQIRASEIVFSGIGSTRMACVDVEKQRIETTILEGLKKVATFRLKENTFELLDRGRVIMRFAAPVKRSPEGSSEAVKLEDMTWRLDSVGGQSVSKNGRMAFIVFDKEKSSAGGNSSCNVFGGSYLSTTGMLKITDIVSTMRACVEDDRMDIERKFLEALREVDRYDIQDSTLTLFRRDRLLLTLIGESK